MMHVCIANAGGKTHQALDHIELVSGHSAEPLICWHCHDHLTANSCWHLFSLGPHICRWELAASANERSPAHVRQRTVSHSPDIHTHTWISEKTVWVWLLSCTGYKPSIKSCSKSRASLHTPILNKIASTSSSTTHRKFSLSNPFSHSAN